MTRSCTACHGSRVGNEYLGKNEGFPGDVHFREARMNCVKCHEGARTCTGTARCAPPVRITATHGTRKTRNVWIVIPTHGPRRGQHRDAHVHGENLSCQVCHSVTYTSCDGCHVAISEKSGNPFFETEKPPIHTFLIGRNPATQLMNAPTPYVPCAPCACHPDSSRLWG